VFCRQFGYMSRVDIFGRSVKWLAIQLAFADVCPKNLDTNGKVRFANYNVAN
jgi:hypothetical protein